MLNLLKKKKQTEKSPIKKEITNNVIVVWSPFGTDTSSFSYKLAQEISRYSYDALIELPCLGIPRLSIVSDIKDRDNHTEAAIIELEKKKRISFEHVVKKNDTLAIMPVGYYAVPDYPIANRVEIETLIDFPIQVINAARNNGYQQVIFECQGQLTNPMTFFAIKNADLVFIPITTPAEVAFALINLKRLLNVFKYEASKFKVIAGGNKEALTEIMQVKDDEGRVIGSPDIWELDLKEILIKLGFDDLSVIREEKRTLKLPFNISVKKTKEPSLKEEDNQEELPEETTPTIRL